MERTADYSRPHYHIRWERKEALDWECLHTYSEAKTRADDLAGPDEKFTIEEVSSDCPALRAKHNSAA